MSVRQYLQRFFPFLYRYVIGKKSSLEPVGVFILYFATFIPTFVVVSLSFIIMFELNDYGSVDMIHFFSILSAFTAMVMNFIVAHIVYACILIALDFVLMIVGCVTALLKAIVSYSNREGKEFIC